MENNLWNHQYRQLPNIVLCSTDDLLTSHVEQPDCHTVNREILVYFLQKRVVLFWCVKFWPFSFLVCLILATFGSYVLKIFLSVNSERKCRSVLISSIDITFLLLLTGYFDVVLKTKSIMDKLWYSLTYLNSIHKK